MACQTEARRAGLRRVGIGRPRLLVALVLVALFGGAAVAQDSSATERRFPPGVDHSASPSALPPLDPTQWSKEELGRIDYLESQIVCRCPKENWSKTLAACPDGCADEQKRMVRESVRAGESDEAIFKAQLQLASTRRVLADPRRAGATTNFLAIAITLVVIASVVGLLVVFGWSRNGKRASATAPGGGAKSDSPAGEARSDITDEEIARVERELEGLR